MALVFNNNSQKRRNCDYTFPQQKKICLKSYQYPSDVSTSNQVRTPHKKSVCFYSSSEEDNDSEDEQSCYNADQIRAKRRASTRVSFSMNSELSRAVSQYSDEDDEAEANDSEIKNTRIYRNNEEECKIKSEMIPSTPQSLTAAVSAANYENLDCKLSSSPISIPFTFNYDDSRFNFNESRHVAIEESTGNSTNNATNTATNASVSSISNVSWTDKSARSRCFEYLVGSIDEAWARYCDAATNVEDEVYGYNTPKSFATDDEDYFDNTTDITDYDDSDFDAQSKRTHLQPQAQFMRPRLSSSASCSSLQSSKEDPSSCQLQALKDRLTKAKYYLQDLVDSDDSYDVTSFWKRWDMIKYATIELVEDDDDDEIIESTIDELESGRYFAN